MSGHVGKVLHLLDEVELHTGKKTRRLRFGLDAVWQTMPERYVVAQEQVPVKTDLHLVGGNGMATQVRDHVRFRLVWAIEIPTSGTLAESPTRDVIRLPHDRAWERVPVVRIGEGDTEQWITAEKAAERAATRVEH